MGERSCPATVEPHRRGGRGQAVEAEGACELHRGDGSILGSHRRP